MIPDSFIQELRFRCDVESIIASYVNLKRRGRNLVGLCPFHSEKTPSFTVYPESQSFFCFGCSAGGDVITFIRQMENLDYVEAIKFLAQKVGMTVPEDAVDDKASRLKTRILEMNRLTARFYHQCLIEPGGKPALDYLLGRALTPKTIRHFGLGYAPNDWRETLNFLKSKGFSEEEIQASSLCLRGRNGGLYDQFRNRVMFPIIDIRGNVIAFGARKLEGDGPKYLNSSDTPVYKKSRNLFALNFAKNSKSDTLILAEGYMDVIALHQAGFENAVATLGTALTPEQARLISGYAQKVVVSYDSDEAGQKAARRAINLFDETGVSVKILKVQGAKDPDEFIKTYGAQRFKLLLEGSASALDFELDKLRQKVDLETPEGKVAFLRDCAQLLAGVNNRLEREVYASKIAQELSVDKAPLMLSIEDVIKKRTRQRQKQEKRDLRMYSQVSASGQRQAPAALQSKDLKAQVSQGKLLAMLLRYPDFYELVSRKLTPQDFTVEENRLIYEAMSARFARGETVDLLSLGAALTQEQMAKLSGWLASVSGMNFTKEDAMRYVDSILAQREQKTQTDIAQMNEEELNAYIHSLASKKKS